MTDLDLVLDWVDPASDEAVAAVRTYLAEIQDRFGRPVDVARVTASDAQDLAPPTGGFLLVRFGDRVVGCGGLRRIDETAGEIKRMWVDPEVRGRRIGVRILHALEDRARELGHEVVRLDTDRVLVEAVAMYVREGYVEIGRYNDNPYPDAFFERRL